ncbi:hypothetical protein, partial [Escherichia coli]|uniref:hypothetical protein n=1 Tax=Escherichia coli TaxID=562 RepID=UPI001958A1B1
ANGCSSTASNNVTVINCQPFTRNFTTCGQTGRTGPSQGQCDGTYGTGIVNVSGGVQLWTVPQTGNYTITAAGAQGGDKSDYQNNGGRGETVSTSIANGCSSTASNNVTVINCQPFTRNFTTCGQTGRT